MKVQMTGSYPCIAALPLAAHAKPPVPPPTEYDADAVMAAIARRPKILPLPLPTTPAPLDLSPLLRARKIHVFSPEVAAQSPSGEKMLTGLRALSDLITPYCGQRVAVTASAIWLGVDGASARRTFRDSKSRPAERVSAAGTVGSDAFALLGGIFNAPHLNQAATVLNFAAVVGDRVHTGQMTFSQSDVVAFSSLPQSDDISNVLKLTELAQSPDGTS